MEKQIEIQLDLNSTLKHNQHEKQMIAKVDALQQICNNLNVYITFINTVVRKMHVSILPQYEILYLIYLHMFLIYSKHKNPLGTELKLGLEPFEISKIKMLKKRLITIKYKCENVSIYNCSNCIDKKIVLCFH